MSRPAPAAQASPYDSVYWMLGVKLTYRQSRITAHPTALICQDTELRGDITIGGGTIIHPKAVIIAAGGPIVFGKNCVVEETSAIINR